MSDNLANQMKRAAGNKHFTPKKIVAYALFGAITLVFVFFGMSSRTGGVAGYVAQVNNSLIGLDDLQREQNRIQQFYSQMFGGSVDLSAQRQFITQEAVQNLVNTELVSQAAKEEGMGATDQEVLDYITKDYSFLQDNGVFQRDRYFQFLEANRMSPADFEDLIRKDIANQRVRRAFEWSAWPNKLENQKIQKLQDVKVTLSYIALNPRELENQMKFSSAEIQQALAKPDFAKRAQDEFQARKSQFDQKEQVKAQHILIRFKDGDTASEKAALAKIQSLRDQAEKTDFGTLAEKNSEDPGSKSKKGDLGYFGRGQMVPEFDNQVFSMKVGEISQPIKTQFGYHLVKLNDKKAAHEANFESQKNTIAQMLLARDLIAQEKSRAQEVFEKGDEKAWMNRLNVNWKDTAAFDLSADAVPGLSDKVVASLGDVLAEPRKAHVVQDGDTQYIVKVKDIKNQSAAEAKANPENLARVKGSQAFEGWIQDYRQSSDVEINPDILK